MNTHHDKPRKGYKIVRTYMDSRARIDTQSTGVHGTEQDALYHFNGYVSHARTNRRLIGLVLIDTSGGVLAEWYGNQEAVA